MDQDKNSLVGEAKLCMQAKQRRNLSTISLPAAARCLAASWKAGPLNASGYFGGQVP